jgi:hypothetical protein
MTIKIKIRIKIKSNHPKKWHEQRAARRNHLREERKGLC